LVYISKSSLRAPLKTPLFLSFGEELKERQTNNTFLEVPFKK